MSTLFSRQCEYALQAVLYLALKPNGEMTTVKELAKRLNVPYHFVAKILQELTYQGLLVSLKGPSGGFALGKQPEDIKLFQIVEAIDGVAMTKSCVLGFPECSDKNPCSLHDQWDGLRNGIYQMLVKKDVGQIANEMRKPEYRSAKH